ncbi:MAG: nitrogen regulation protein NR(II) [Desulfobacterales bacterium]
MKIDNQTAKIKLLRNFLIALLLIAASLSFYNIYFIYPSFTRLLIESTKNDAVRATRHLASLLNLKKMNLDSPSLNKDFLNEIEKIKNDFGLMKLHVYSKRGRTLFSTDPADIDLINQKKDFREIVAKGKVYAKVVRQDTESLEGQKMDADVVETYVPLMKGDNFLGAFEIYYDITERNQQLDKLVSRSNSVLLALICGLFVAIVIVFVKERSITAVRKNTETALRESEEKLTGILNAVTDLIIVVDQARNIIWANLTAAEFFGTDLVGQQCCRDFECRNIPGISDHIERCFADGRNYEHEVEITAADSVRRHFWCTVSAAVRARSGIPKTVIVVYRDVTEKKLLEAETARASQLASVGELAAGVAHEINNPINGIINCAQMLIDEEDIAGEQAEISKRILNAGERIAMIVRNLLSFARNRQEEPEAVPIQTILSDALDLTEAQLQNDGIDLRLDIADDVPMVTARGNQMQQVFLNIISNARYALNQKYAFAHYKKIFKISAATLNDNSKKYARLVFLDYGVGIPADILDRICDPFFSTKPAGEGTGLGLSVSHSIIKDHGAKLNFDSVEGEYAKIIIDLPAALEEIGDQAL